MSTAAADQRASPTQSDTEEVADAASSVIVEDHGIKIGNKVGACKWFNNVHGYGFLTIVDGEDKGADVFVHHSGIKPSNSQYKTLKKGEYLTFDVVEGTQGLQAVNVRGICGGPLLCDHIPIRKHVPQAGAPPGGLPPPPPRRQPGANLDAGSSGGWTRV